MEPATGRSRLDDGADVRTQAHGEWAQLSEYLREPLLRAATAVLKAMAELPDQRVDHELAGLGLSTQINLTALTEHLTTATQALSLADGVRQTLLAGLPVGGGSA
jgi:hypothetical protein